jgi:hypothetical protein
MRTPVYRLPVPAKQQRRAMARRTVDGTALAALAVLWIVSLLRVIGAIGRHEVFGAESTLALLCLVAAPWLAWPRRVDDSMGQPSDAE